MKLGTYHYKFMGYRAAVRTLQEYTLRVQVLEESKNCYRVKYMGFHANGAAVGYTTWVKKTSVKLDQAEDTQVKPGPTRDDIRLPYKD